MSIIAFYPAFGCSESLTDHFYRLHWYLYPFKRKIKSVEMISQKGTLVGNIPDYFDETILNTVDKFDNIQISDDSKVDINNIIKTADIILLWDNNFEDLLYKKINTKSQKVIRIDHNNVKNSSSFYLYLSQLDQFKSREYLKSSKEVFNELVKNNKAEIGYIFGTGPNLSSVYDYDFSDGISVACNSMVTNEKLLKTINPKIIVMGDPIFHAGPSKYAGEFREKLQIALEKYECYLIFPLRDYHIYKSYLPEQFHKRMIGIPILNKAQPNFNLSKEFYLTSTPNILTLILIPLSATLFEKVRISGCDGRPKNENNYFWQHDKSSQLNDKMENIKITHPAFFIINYDDYYQEHCETTKLWISQAISLGKDFSSLTKSYIPAINNIFKTNNQINNPITKSINNNNESLWDANKTSENIKHFILIDPDGKNWNGHYMAYNEKLSAQMEILGIYVNVFCRKDIAPEIITKYQNYIPTFNTHSWSVGNKEANFVYLNAFESELGQALEKFFLEHVEPTLLYMYCGSLDHAQILAKFVEKYPLLSVNVNLFWLSFNPTQYKTKKFSDFFTWLENKAWREKFLATLPTFELQNELSAHTGYTLPVAPHPSTGLSDLDFQDLQTIQLDEKSPKKFHVLFPGSTRKEKGYSASIECAKILGVRSGFVPIIRHAPISTTPKEYCEPLNDMPAAVEVVEGELSNKQFLSLFRRTNISVIPYTLDAFSNRTSGLLIDSIYHGIPCVVVRGTWLGNLVERYHCGEVVEDVSASHLADAVEKISQNYNQYRSQTIKTGLDYFSKNSWALFGKYLIALANGEKLSRSDNFVELEAIIGPCPRFCSSHLDETKGVAELFESVLSGSTMIDVGAHHGSALIPFLNKGWNIYAFEPDKQNRSNLLKRLSNHKNKHLVSVDNRCVSNKSLQGMSFFTSEQSTGISGLSSFHDTHVETQTVDVTTLSEFFNGRGMPEVDFLKIDTEGHDLFVLQGFPWSRSYPAVIECEFEDAKTVPLGYTYHDLAQFLMDKGYTVYVSEWHPIIRYGIRHDWRQLMRYPSELADSLGWGNLLAFRDPIDEHDLVKAVLKILKVDHPDKNVTGVDKPAHVVGKPELNPKNPAIEKSETSPFLGNKSNSFNMTESRTMIIRFSSYAQFAEWVRGKNLTLFRLGQFVMWVIRFPKRQPNISLVGFLILIILIVAPLSSPALEKYTLGFWGMALGLIFVLLSLVGISFVNEKMMEFIERQARLRNDIQRQSDRVFQNKIEKLSYKFETLSQSQQDQAGTIEGLQGEIQARSEGEQALTAQLETLSQSQQDLSNIMDQKVNKQVVTSIANFSEFQPFNRYLSQDHIQIIQKEWLRKLSLDFSSKQLSYFADKICSIEARSRGRIATSIENIMLRGLVAASVKGETLRVLEIGTLFGIGISAINAIAQTRFKSVHYTAIDPLDGYYGLSEIDLTGEPVNEQLFHENLKVAGIEKSNYSLIKMLSTDSNAIETAAKPIYDVLVIDGDHSFSGVKSDFLNYLPSVKVGGYIIFDDYNAKDWPDVEKFVDSIDEDYKNVSVVGVSWRTKVFRVVSRSKINN